MADTLKATLYWSANPDVAFVDNTGSLGYIETRRITAAEAHDFGNATYEGLKVVGDGNTVADGLVTCDKALIAASGGIKFVRTKYRAKTFLVSGPGAVLGSMKPRINGIEYGGDDLPDTGGYADYTHDFPVDPTDGMPWTAAKVNAYTWGFRARITTDDAATAVEIQVPEFTVEVWGGDVTATATPAIARGVVPDETGLAVTKDLRDPTATAQLGTTLDQGSALVTVRSFLPALADQDVSTRSNYDTTGASGTRLEPLYGSGTQGVQGTSGAGGGINGSGVISGIKLFVLARCAKSASSTMTNVRFGTAMGVKALEVAATIRDYDAGLTDAQFEVLNSILITTGQFANPFTWGNGTDSVWASLFGWTFNHTYTNAGGHTAVAVAEAWVEIYGPVGSQPIIIELTHALGLPVMQQPLEGQFP